MRKTDKKSIRRLNKLYKGAKAGSKTYERYSTATDNLDTLCKFKQFSRQYEEYAQEIAVRIEALGGKARDGGKIAERTAKFNTALKMMGKTDDTLLLKSAYKGEKMSVEAGEELLSSAIDNKSKEIISRQVDRAKHNANVIVDKIVTNQVRDFGE